MVTVFVYAVLAIVVVAALVALAVLVLPGTEQLAPAPADRTPWALPAERAMTGPDVGRLRLPVTLRGYRFAETDAVLDRLGEEIAYRDTVIATLQAELDGRSPYADPGAEVLIAPGEDELVAPGEDEPVASAPVASEPGEDEPVASEPGEDELVELGETPEETEHEVERIDQGAVDLDAPVEVVEVVELPVGAEPEPDVELESADGLVVEPEPVVEHEPAVESEPAVAPEPAVESEPAVEPEPTVEPQTGPQVVALDDDLAEFGERDDVPPDGTAPRP